MAEPEIPKSEWGEGPWQDEPDEHRWTDAATGLPCIAHRNMQVTGSWCGYIGVPPEHPAYGLHYDGGTIDEEAQRQAAFRRATKLLAAGKTFGGAWKIAYEGVPENTPTPGVGERISEVVCHWGLTYGGEGEWLKVEGDWWFFGFDCSHAGDLCPRVEALMRLISPPSWMAERERIKSTPGPFRETYKPLSYVIEQCTDLAAQLAKAAETTISIMPRGRVSG